MRGLRLMAAYAAGLTAVGVITSLARGGFVGMLSGLAVVIPVSKLRSARAGAGVALVLGLGAAFMACVGVVVPYQRLVTLLESGSYIERLTIWKIALHAWTMHPIWGLGVGTFAFTGRFFDDDEGVFAGHAENEYVEMLVEGGVVGLAVGVVLLVSVLKSGLQDDVRLRAVEGSRASSDSGGDFRGRGAGDPVPVRFSAPHSGDRRSPPVILAAHLSRSRAFSPRIRRNSLNGCRGELGWRPLGAVGAPVVVT